MTHDKEMEPAHHSGEVVRRLYEQAINERRLDLLPELVSPEYIGPRGEQGPDGFAATITGLTDGVPDIRFEIQELVACADAVTVRWQWTGLHSGTLFGLQPSHKQVTTTGLVLYHLVNGKIARSNVETDRLGLLQQIGAVPESLGASRRVR